MPRCGDLIGFCRDLGLPVRLADLGMREATSVEIDEIARLTMTAPHVHNLAHEVTATDVALAMRRVEALAGGGWHHGCHGRACPGHPGSLRRRTMESRSPGEQAR